MGFRTTAVILSAFAVAEPALASTLAPDALVCESDAEILFVRQTPFLADKPGSYVIDQAKVSLKSIALMNEAAGIVQTRDMRNSADRGAVRGPQYQRLVDSCASSGAVPASVTVLERKAISGVTKVTMVINGLSATVWTPSTSVRD